MNRVPGALHDQHRCVKMHSPGESYQRQRRCHFHLLRPFSQMLISLPIRRLVCLTLFCVTSSAAEAAIIRLDNTPGGLGALLDETDIGDLGTPAAGPIGVPGIAGLDITVIAIGDDENTLDNEDVNSTASSLGVNATNGTDDADAFDAAFSEFATFRFNSTVAVSSLDFTSFTAGEVFEFAGSSITEGDLTDGVGKVITFASPLIIQADTDFTMRALVGTIGIEAFNIAVVPEPSSCGLLSLGGLALFGHHRRRRRRTKPSQLF